MEIYVLKEEIDKGKQELDETYRNLCIPEYRKRNNVILCQQQTKHLKNLLSDFETSLCLLERGVN